ncbi:MAG TPA: APC family permease [Solirubrobacteraceae bacterium]|nr:APC family permease [Solirubrobacteraceae bacterium]
MLVVGSLADVAARYGLLLVGWDSAAASKPAVTAIAVVIIALMTAICVLGTELSARVQNVMIFAQVLALLIFAVVALVKGGPIDPSLSWFSPFALENSEALVAGLLIGVFIYWGWESAVNLTEETEDSATTPGLAAVLSTVILLVTYLAVAVAVVSFAGLDRVAEFEDDDAILSTLAGDVLGSPLDQLLVLAVLTSALASTQTTILPASRTVLSMARGGAMPKSLGSVHPRFLTPHVSTILIGILATVWYVPLNLLSENFLFFGVAPLTGGLLLAFLFVRSVRDLADPDLSYSGSSFLGLGLPLVIGAGFLLLGAVLMVLWRIGNPRGYFERRGLEAVSPEVAAGRAEPAPVLD